MLRTSAAGATRAGGAGLGRRNAARRSRLIAGVGWAALLLAAGSPVLAVDLPGASRVPMPAIAPAAAGQCVEDTAFMRRNHMDLLKHHRDRTVREGIRTTRHSLANCVACHADPATGQAAGSPDAFCESCHRYAAVQLDCWDCHTDRRKPVAAAAGAPR